MRRQLTLATVIITIAIVVSAGCSHQAPPTVAPAPVIPAQSAAPQTGAPSQQQVMQTDQQHRAGIAHAEENSKRLVHKK